MKKRLLITSIVMMLVCAVALSTATYAWFTQNGSVEATSMTLRAAVSDAPALGIGWTGSAANTSIESAVSGVLQPMAPTDLTLNSTVSETLKYYTSTVKQEAGFVKFNQNSLDSATETEQATVQVPLTYANSSANSFYVRNLSNANTIQAGIRVSVEFPEINLFKQVNTSVVTSPVAGVEYYTYDNTNYTKVENLNAFADNTNYYVYNAYAKPTRYAINETYYNLDNNGNYVKVDSANVNEGNYSNYFVQVNEYNANDMIRVALFKKEYRTTEDASINDGKTYYYYDPNDNIIKVLPRTIAEANSAISNGVHTISGYVVYELTESTAAYVKTNDQSLVPGKIYYTKSNDAYTPVTNPVSGELTTYFELTGHKLFAVLGQSATVYAKEEVFDMNHVYYTAPASTSADGATKLTDVTESNFEQKKKDGIYTFDGAKWVLASTFNSNNEYYRVAFTRDNSVNASNFGTGKYYTAASTAVYGEIVKDKNVIAMNYYNNVKVYEDFATQLKPGEQIDIVAYAWLDGTLLDDTRQGDVGLVNLKFDALS